jgi:hypothetical protein
LIFRIEFSNAMLDLKDPSSLRYAGKTLVDSGLNPE